MWRRSVYLFLAHIFILHTCFIQFLAAADLRMRSGNNIVPRNVNLKKSANGTDVVDILNPQNGNSINKFDRFDVGDKNSIILNNSMQDGTSTTGGLVSRNPNLTTNANLITIEILSGTASKINGTVEVFGKSADLLFANENGFSFNGANFLNTNGLNVVAGKIDNDIASVTGNGKVDILDRGIAIDGNYFNIIARSINLAGNISHSKEGKTLNNINLIAGLNDVNLKDKANPQIKNTKSTASKNSNKLAINGSSLGSMHGNNIKFISTEEGMGVKHKGMITSAEQILLMANGDIETDTLISENVKIKAPTHTYKNSNKVAGTNVSIKAKNVENAGDIYSGDLDIEAVDFVKNFGMIGAEKNLTITAKTITNEGKRTAGSGIVGNVGNTVNSNGYVGYGDTAFKTWTTGLSYKTYGYDYDAKTDDFTSATMIANNVVLKADTVNNKGIIYGDTDVNIKGSLNNITLTTNKPVTELLNSMKLTGPLTSKEYLGAWNTNGTTYFNSGTSMLTVLKDLANSNWKDHQREAIWNAVKDAANKDPNLKQALEILIGKDYAGKRFIPNVSSWNQNAKLVFVPADKKSGIYSNKTLNIAGDKIISGVDVDVSKNLTYLVGKYTTKEVVPEPVPVPESSKPESPKYPTVKVDGESEKGLAVIKANSDITIQANNVLNKLSSVVSKLGKVTYKVNGTFEGKDSEVSGNSVEITADNVKSEGDIYKSEKTLAVTASRDIDIKGGNLLAKDIKLTSTNGNVKIGTTQNVHSTFSQTITDNSQSTKSEIAKTNIGSNLVANNITIAANKRIDFVGSNAEAENKFLAQAKKVNIEDSINEYIYAENSRNVGLNTQGIIQLNTHSNNAKSLISNGSSIKGGGNINIIGSDELRVKGSHLNAKEDMTLMGNNVNIVEGRNVVKSDSFSTAFNPLGYKDEKNEIYAQTYSASTLAGNNINIKGNYVGITGTDIANTGTTNIVGNKVKLSAAKNTLQTKTTKNAFGLIAGASAGIAGYGASAQFNGANAESNTAIFNGNQKGSPNTSLASGAMLSDSLANAEFGLEFTHKTESVNKTFYTHSNLQGNNINVTAADVLDFGGGNFKATNDVNLVGGKVETTKYTDKTETTSDGFSLYAKQSLDTTSNIASLVNQGANNAHNAMNGNNLNAGIVAGQTVSNAINLALGDLAAETSTQKAGFSFEHSSGTYTKENMTNIESNKGNINIKSTKGDMTLNGVEAKAENIALTSSDKININTAKSSYSSEGYGVGAEVRFQQSAGVGALSGANAQLGVGGSVNASYQKGNGTSHTNSTFTAKNGASIASVGDTTIIGGNIKAKDISLDVANLNLQSAVDTNNSMGFGIDVGGDVSLGVASSTIFTGDASGNAGIMYNQSESNLVNKQSSIVAQNAVNGNVKGDVNLGGAVIGSQSKQGNLNVGGNVNAVDLALFEKSDGANVSISGGTDGDFGADINIDDHIDKNSVLKSGINVAINGKQDHNINNDIENTSIMNDNSWVGGSMNFTANINTLKDAVGKVKDKFGKHSGSYDVNNKVDSTRKDSVNSKVYDDISPYSTTKNLGLSDSTTPTKPNLVETPIYDKNGNKTHISVNGDLYAVIQKDTDSKDSSYVVSLKDDTKANNPNKALLQGVAAYPDGMPVNLSNEFWTTMINKHANKKPKENKDSKDLSYVTDTDYNKKVSFNPSPHTDDVLNLELKKLPVGESSPSQSKLFYKVHDNGS